MRLICAALFSLSLLTPALALALDPDTLGKINADMAEREAKVRKESFGGKSEKEMSPSERREFSKQMRDQHKEVLEKRGVSEKDYEIGRVKMSREDRKATQEAQTKEETKRAADAKKAEEAKNAKTETKIEVQRGMGKDAPEGKMTEIPVPQGGNNGK